MSDQPKPISYPAYFTSLTVEGLRCFKEKQTLKLSNEDGHPAQWTVILGDNGTGKTTLLQALTALEPITFPVFTGNGKPFGYSIIPYIQYTLELQKKLIGSIFCDFVLQENIKALSPLLTIENFSLGNNNFDNSGENIDVINIESKVYAYGAARKMSYSSLDPADRPNEKDSIFGEKVLLENIEEFFLQAYFATKEAKGEVQKYAESRYNKIKEVLTSDMLPDIEDIRSKEITKDSLSLGIEVKTPYGWVRMKDLSMGYQTLMAWMVDLMSRLFDQYPDSDNPIAEPAVVLIDEIDLHLHPKWQQKLMGHLSKYFTNTQFIVTAHSPLIVQSDVEANIVVLKREGDQVVIHNNPVDVDGWRVDQLLTSDLFGLPSGRSPKYQELLDEQSKLLSKGSLTQEDEKRLAQLDSELSHIPYLRNEGDNEARKMLRDAAKWIREKKIGTSD